MRLGTQFSLTTAKESDWHLVNYLQSKRRLVIHPLSTERVVPRLGSLTCGGINLKESK